MHFVGLFLSSEIKLFQSFINQVNVRHKFLKIGDESTMKFVVTYEVHLLAIRAQWHTRVSASCQHVNNVAISLSLTFAEPRVAS